jgi:methionyl-tRNA synthetase
VPPIQRDVPGQVICVWIELAFGFIYGIESLGRTLGTGWQASAPQDDWKIVHFLGYDNTFYHSILGPALYHLASPGWTPDVDYNVNEFYLLDGDKFSTSRRHAIWGKDILNPETVDGIRYYLALTRPETTRTNFTLAGYETVLRERLTGTWQRWLNDLGDRVVQRYDGVVPDAGIWTPEHTDFFGRLGLRLSEMTAHLSPDGFALNRAAQTLHAIVEDTLAFSAAEAATAGLDEWYDESRTAIALELAAARLLATCAAPVMPRFAARLAAALGVPPPASWLEHVALVPAGTKPDLAREVFFGPAGAAAEPSPLLPWLSGLVREALRLPETEQVADATLVSLGVESLQAIALQYQILERTGADVTVENLLGDTTIAQLAASLPADEDPGLSQAREEVGA